MRVSPELVRGPTPVQTALARVRLPAGPRACEFAAIATVALVAALVLAPLTLAQRLPNGYDTDAFYAPFATFLHDRLSHGDLPLWNPFAFSGQPFAADPQSGVFYPPALASYGLFAPATGMVLLVSFHYLLATLSSYAFARLLGAGRLGAVYAGLAFGVRATCSRALRGRGAADRPRRRPAAVVAAVGQRHMVRSRHHGIQSRSRAQPDLLHPALGDRLHHGDARVELESLIQMCTVTGIRPAIDVELPLDRAREGFERMLEGRTAGKIVFTL